ncbi:MAG: 2-phospho-L-lactate transferase [Myxococcota bacterium]|nr:2-phospho-L-lactate transferase [Myxococcota bacterium]
MSNNAAHHSSDPSPDSRIVALCGGVGAARFLRGLVLQAPPERVTAIVNTGDDREFYGVHVAPDLDIVTYSLAGLVNEKLGYGLSGDTFQLIDNLEKLGHETWFRLGDRDFAHCLHRTLQLRDGQTLAEISRSLSQALGVVTRILPMSEAACPTLVDLADGTTLHFEEYMIREGAPDSVKAIDLRAATRAQPGPGVLEAIAEASAILFCPSNPVVSIGPILAVPGVREAILESKAPRIAISPIVGGAPIKGPASQLLRGIGVEVSALGVARHYRELIDGYVLDERDAELEKEIAELGLATRVTDSIMVDPEAAGRLAAVTLELAESLR